MRRKKGDSLWQNGSRPRRSLSLWVLLAGVLFCAALYRVQTLWTDSTSDSVSSVVAFPHSVCLSRLMSSNLSAWPDASGEYSDWIELANPGNR